MNETNIGKPIGTLTDEAWDRFRDLSDEDIRAAIANDPDTYEPSPERLDKARRQVAKTVTVHLDRALVERLGAGPDLDSRINSILREALDRHNAA
ncbi:hypothetical protein ABB55_21320 [Prosthecomicrobium hirschii]|uniref:BrnA antitoxin of type II toxin-antitoxin system n=1 Tax=Prosthecodimorpha hirschii TaxID=665126 RepID=A0A0N8GFI8_9HYPH|nr:hypothetical protein [Prosthecomicrobium hirschii]KPL54441.1 hypothetical protein ABB55_21320 [Prosthecomicrobium hirschii]